MGKADLQAHGECRVRVLFLTTDAFGGHGGVAQYNRDILSALCSHPRCEEVVAFPRIVRNGLEPLPNGLTYVTTGLDGKLRYVSAVFRHIRANPRFDLLVCGHINLAHVAYAFGALTKAPSVLLVYGLDAWRPPGSHMAGFAAQKFDALVSISDLTRRRFLTWAKRNKAATCLLPNAVDLTRFTPGRKSRKLMERHGLREKTVLMTMGRLSSLECAKGFDEVITLLPELARAIPNVTYLICGDGDDGSRLGRLAESTGVEERVVFVGYVSEEEKVDYHRLADVYVMPGRLEGFGFVFLEAMACGIPVVASKADGSREAVRGGALGVLVDPADVQGIKAGILEALRRPKGVVPAGLEHFSHNNFERRVHQLVDNLVGFTPVSDKAASTDDNVASVTGGVS